MKGILYLARFLCTDIFKYKLGYPLGFLLGVEDVGVVITVQP